MSVAAVVEAEGVDRAQVRIAMRMHARNFQPQKPRAGVHRDLKRGWLLPVLTDMDSYLWGRWDYWAELTHNARLPERPIPRIEWVSREEGKVAERMLTASLNCITSHGEWMSWGSAEYFRYFLDWLLYAFGSSLQVEAPREPRGCEGASDRLYQVFCLEALQLWPYDYLGDLLAETKYGRHNGFFPTPLSLVGALVQMSFETQKRQEDSRLATTMDPCVGTGRFLLEASNYSLLLSGMDIDGTMVRATCVNGYLYAPWLVLSPSFLKGLEGDGAPAVVESEAAASTEGAVVVGKAGQLVMGI